MKLRLFLLLLLNSIFLLAMEEKNTMNVDYCLLRAPSYCTFSSGKVNPFAKKCEIIYRNNEDPLSCMLNMQSINPSHNTDNFFLNREGKYLKGDFFSYLLLPYLKEYGQCNSRITIFSLNILNYKPSNVDKNIYTDQEYSNIDLYDKLYTINKEIKKHNYQKAFVIAPYYFKKIIRMILKKANLTSLEQCKFHYIPKEYSNIGTFLKAYPNNSFFTKEIMPLFKFEILKLDKNENEDENEDEDIIHKKNILESMNGYIENFEEYHYYQLVLEYYYKYYFLFQEKDDFKFITELLECIDSHDKRFDVCLFDIMSLLSQMSNLKNNQHDFIIELLKDLINKLEIINSYKAYRMKELIHEYKEKILFSEYVIKKIEKDISRVKYNEDIINKLPFKFEGDYINRPLKKNILNYINLENINTVNINWSTLLNVYGVKFKEEWQEAIFQFSINHKNSSQWREKIFAYCLEEYLKLKELSSQMIEVNIDKVLLVDKYFFIDLASYIFYSDTMKKETLEEFLKLLLREEENDFCFGKNVLMNFILKIVKVRNNFIILSLLNLLLKKDGGQYKDSLILEDSCGCGIFHKYNYLSFPLLFFSLNYNQQKNIIEQNSKFFNNNMNITIFKNKFFHKSKCSSLRGFCKEIEVFKNPFIKFTEIISLSNLNYYEDLCE